MLNLNHHQALSAGADGALVLWDLGTRRPISVSYPLLDADEAASAALNSSEGSSSSASSSTSGQKPKRGRRPRGDSQDDFEAPDSSAGSIMSLAVSGNGRRIVTAIQRPMPVNTSSASSSTFTSLSTSSTSSSSSSFSRHLSSRRFRRDAATGRLVPVQPAVLSSLPSLSSTSLSHRHDDDDDDDPIKAAKKMLAWTQQHYRSSLCVMEWKENDDIIATPTALLVQSEQPIIKVCVPGTCFSLQSQPVAKLLLPFTST